MTELVAEISLEQARAVIDAHDAAESAKKIEMSQRLVGRYFKIAFHSEGEETFGRCAVVTGVDGSGCPTGQMCQIRAKKGSLYDFYPPFTPPFSGWTEIDEQEFHELTALLPPEK